MTESWLLVRKCTHDNSGAWWGSVLGTLFSISMVGLSFCRPHVQQNQKLQEKGVCAFSSWGSAFQSQNERGKRKSASGEANRDFSLFPKPLLLTNPLCHGMTHLAAFPTLCHVKTSSNSDLLQGWGLCHERGYLTTVTADTMSSRRLVRTSAPL